VAATVKPRRLRPYQSQAVKAWHRDVERGKTRSAVVLPTGCGKSTVGAGAAVPWAQENGPGSVLAVAHRDELLTQLTNTFSDLDPMLPIGRWQASRKDAGRHITVASIQTLWQAGGWEKYERANGRPGMILYDEAHHAVSSSSVSVLNAAGAMHGHSPTPLLGLTATMVRGDRIGLGDVWQSVAFQRDIGWAIREGFLVVPRGKVIVVKGLHLDTAKVSGGDYQEGELGSMIEQSVEEIVDAWQKFAEDRITASFSPTVESAQALTDEFNARGIPAATVVGDTPREERARIYAGLASGDIKVCSGVMVTTEGWDAPAVSCILQCRPTRLPGLYCFDRQTELLTRDGWRPGYEVRPGEEVSAFDSTTGEVRWERVSTAIERALYPDERMVSLSSPTIDFRVTDTHRVVYDARRTPGWRVATAGELLKRRSDWRMPVAGQEKFRSAALSDAEVALIGWVQTDGSINRANGVLSVSQQDPEQCAEIERVLTACGLKWRVAVHAEPTNFGERRHPLRVYRVSRGRPRGEDKHLSGWSHLAGWIPRADPGAYVELDDLDERQWRILLDAMHRANGAKRVGVDWTPRGYDICTPDRRMADWLQAGCMRRGWRANVAVHVAGRERPLYMLHCREESIRHVGGIGQDDRSHLEVSPSDPDERVWCVSVPSGALLTRRNGKGAILGNCQIVGRGLRTLDPEVYPGHPPKEDCLVLDCVGASRYQKLTTLVDLYESAEIDSTELDDVLPEEDEQLDEDEGAGLELPKPKLIGPKEYEDVNLFADSGYVWLFTYGGVRFLPAGDRIAVMWQHPKTGKLRVGHCLSKPRYDRTTRQYDRDGVWLRDGWGSLDGWDLDTGRLALEAWVDNYAGTLAKKGASWRKGKSTPPTEAQIMMATRLGIDEPQLYSKAALSDEISIAFASQMLD
jgi:hypothetical protein